MDGEQVEEIWNAEEIGMGEITSDLEAREARRPAEESRWRERERAVEPFELRPVILAVDPKIGRSEMGRKCGAREQGLG
jgi:hypothetical protein